MNKTLDKANNTNLETDFNTAIQMSKKVYDYKTLIEFLSSDKVVEKQLALLELKEIKSKDDAAAIVLNLIKQDGRVREAAAIKIKEFIQDPKYSDFFIDETFFKIFLEGLLDINGNVCRQISSKWTGNCAKAFELYLCNNLPSKIRELLQEISLLEEKSKQYIVSKKNFQLYWCLEALYNIIENIKITKIKDIITTCGNFYDYTIREKTAKLLTKIESLDINDIKEQLKNDKNYYVRRLLQ